MTSACWVPVPVAARSKAWVCSSWLAGIVGSNTAGDVNVCVCCDCCVLSGRGLCGELITRPEESYRLCCVVVCDLGTSWTRKSWLTEGGGEGGAVAPEDKKKVLCSLTNWYDTSCEEKHMQREIDVLWMLIFKTFLFSSLRFNLTEPFPRDVVIHLDPILSQKSPLQTFRNLFPWHPVSIFGL